MFGKETRALGIYLFNRAGVPLLSLPSGESLPVEPAQVEGVLALAGEFDNVRHENERVARIRYDGFRILGMHGERAVVAAVSRDALDRDVLPELERFLRRCDKSLRPREPD